MQRVIISATLLLIATLGPGFCILNGGDTTKYPRTLCETDYCWCSGDFSTVNCTCSGESPPLGQLVLHADGAAEIPHSLSFLRVSRCERVIVTSRAFAMLRSLRRIELINIRELDVHESGLVWEPHRHGNHTLQIIGGGPIVNQYEEVYGGPNTLPSVTILLDRITNCPQLPPYAFGGHLDLITISNTNINKINSYAFTNLRGRIEKIDIKNTNINFIDALAFKRIYIETLSILNSYIHKIQSRSIFETRIKRDFILDNVTIDVVSSLSFGISGPVKTIIKGSRFKHISGESFRIATRGSVLISDNLFEIIDSGALAGIQPMTSEELLRETFLYNPEDHDSPHTFPSREDGGKPAKPNVDRPDITQYYNNDWLMQNNTIKEYAKGALYINKNYEVTFSRLILADTTCHCTGLVNLITDLVGIPESPYEEFASAPAHNTEQLYRTTWCRMPTKYTTLPEFKEEHCSTINKGSVIFIAIGVAVLVLIIIVLIATLIWFVWWRKKIKAKKKTQLNLVVPDTRTYKETEFQVIVEHVEPLPQPPETHQLLNGNNENKHVTFQN